MLFTPHCDASVSSRRNRNNRYKFNWLAVAKSHQLDSGTCWNRHSATSGSVSIGLLGEFEPGSGYGHMSITNSLMSIRTETESGVIFQSKHHDSTQGAAGCQSGDVNSRATALILVVDQDPIRGQETKQLLEGNGFLVMDSSLDEPVLRVMDDACPDLILLAVNSPSEPGVQFLRSVRSRYSSRRLPVLVSISESDRPLGAMFIGAGASDVLITPIDEEILLARVTLHVEHRKVLAELQQSQERYALAAQGARIGLWDLDVTRQQIFLSSRWKELLGFRESDLNSTIETWIDRIHPDDRDAFLRMISACDSDADGRFDFELRMRHRDDSYRWMLCSGVTQCDSSGELFRLAGSLSDVTEGKVRDALTGLPNRLLFEEQLAKFVHLDQSRHGLSAVLFLDLDEFKRINDNYGHDAGDLLLCSVARRLESCLRGSDIVARQNSGWSVARHGGDEFTILLHQLHVADEAEQIASRLIAALSEPFLIGTLEVLIGVSVGISFCGSGSKTPADAIREADIAMYNAKSSGRGRYCVFDPEMQAGATARLNLENDIREAICRGEFYLVYQPIVRLSSGRITGFEALCRWRHPRGEVIGPNVFMPLIESLGLTSRLGKVILETACQEAVKWNRLAIGGQKISVTVNCSCDEFGQANFKHDLLLTISRIGINPSTLRLEVNESALLGNPEQTRSMMNDLRDLGIRIGIDDFGTGFSSLAFLHRIPLDLLKIDNSFVRNMMQCGETRDIVRTIINLAENLNLDVVAEGIETDEQRDLLFEMGCSHAQGYLYSQPVLSSEIPNLLLSNETQQSLPSPVRHEGSEQTRIETQLNNLDDLMRLP